MPSPVTILAKHCLHRFSFLIFAASTVRVIILRPTLCFFFIFSAIICLCNKDLVAVPELLQNPYSLYLHMTLFALLLLHFVILHGASISFHYFQWSCCYYYLLNLVSSIFLLRRIFIPKNNCYALFLARQDGVFIAQRCHFWITTLDCKDTSCQIFRVCKQRWSPKDSEAWSDTSWWRGIYTFLIMLLSVCCSPISLQQFFLHIGKSNGGLNSRELGTLI